MCPSILLLVIEIKRPSALDKISLCLGSQETATDFLLNSKPRMAKNSSMVGQSSAVPNHKT